MPATVLTPSFNRLLLMIGLAVGVLLALLWLTGMLEALRPWLLDQQRSVQGQLAAAVRQVRGGQPGAWVGLLAVCFGYGVVHAAGPGHGKLVVGGYGVARRVPLARLAGIALLASLAQAAVAVVLVGAGVLAFGWSRERLEAVNATWIAPLGSLAIASVGLWLVARGLRTLWRRHAAQEHISPAHNGPDRTHAHSHDHQHHDEICTHAHGPSMAQVESLTGPRDAIALIAGIALRPCTGALFLLILTFAIGIGAAGIAGTFAMGLGTGAVTVAVACLSVWSREGLWASLPTAGITRAMPLVEIAAGAVIAVVALSLIGTAP